MHEEEVFAVFLGALTCLILAWIVLRYSFLAFKQWQATRLIRDMISRGYTAQEIIQICQVLGHKRFPPLGALSDVPPAKPIKQPAY